jgi:thymidylate synthase ThyX
MTITAKVSSRSTSPGCGEITSILVRYPWFIHPEVMTHRVFSRSFMSGRAIPTTRMLAEILSDPAMPEQWGANQPGMQADNQLSPLRQWLAKQVWLVAMRCAVLAARLLSALGAHKQVANRVVMPFAHIQGIVTSTEWDNFFDLRCHPAADPTMRVLAEKMREAIERHGNPAVLSPGEWHTPLALSTDNVEHQKLTSVAGAARVSYGTHDGSKRTVHGDLRLADDLLTSKHMSPFEHQATPRPNGDADPSNFNRFWQQFRQEVDK